jgi:GMP synthase-like glutamine amidotransferase
MKTLCVLQHTEAEYLGLMEDHLEARSIRFQYVRPFTPGGMVPESAEGFDGLIVLGAGPLGIVSGSLLPSLAPELRLIADFLKRGLPVTGIGLGAVLLAVAAGGGAEEAPLRFEVASARSKAPGALGGHLPETIPVAIYMRDAPVLPDDAQVLAEGEGGEPVVFALHGNCFGFLGHPGAKSAMIEDLIMEFDEAPDDTAAKLEALRTCQAEITEALSQIMVGIVHDSGWMTVPQGEALS